MLCLEVQIFLSHVPVDDAWTALTCLFVENLVQCLSCSSEVFCALHIWANKHSHPCLTVDPNTYCTTAVSLIVSFVSLYL